MKKILLIDQQLKKSLPLCQQLQLLGYVITIVDNGFNALVAMESNQFEVILLDSSVTQMDAFWLLMGKHCQTPVIVITNNASVDERIAAFELGADDYLPEPINVKELLLRVNVLNRRTTKQTHDSMTHIANIDFAVIESQLTSGQIEQTTEKQHIEQSANVEFDDDNNAVTFNGQQLNLTQTEYRLFKYLFKRKGEIVTKSELQMRVLHKELGEFDRNLDMHISNTRRKMAKESLPRELINTVRGKGYCFSPLFS
ncbi:response regulator transcription factor [Shewanella sp. 5_MG-2023]|uniref:response regulator transcription factor n=1 Tax=Shewanella sp. 5_MG-2023 TaxID=3062656 RepID=UPI0026E11DD0|nr:response regulator transcription factor [Shewanella sp. 5_MG-2023]MDO6640485.1 response regulator transcription factor [Shewanella sp. 5_MG-2023]